MRSFACWVSSWDHISGADVDITSNSCGDTETAFSRSAAAFSQAFVYLEHFLTIYTCFPMIVFINGLTIKTLLVQRKLCFTYLIK